MTDQTFTQPPPSLQQQTQRAWAIAHVWRGGGSPRREALRALGTIHEATANPRLIRLCESLAFEMYPEARTPTPAAAGDIVVETFAR